MTSVQRYSNYVLRDDFKYCVGQTLNEAQQNNADIQFFRRLDSDGNGILSQEEILKGRLSYTKDNSGGFGVALGVEGATLGGVGYAIKKFGKSTKGTVVGTLAMIGGAILAGIGCYSLLTGKNSNVSMAQEELDKFYADKEARALDEQYKGNILEVPKEEAPQEIEQDVGTDTTKAKEEQDDDTRQTS